MILVEKMQIPFLSAPQEKREERNKTRTIMKNERRLQQKGEERKKTTKSKGVTTNSSTTL